MSLKKYNAKRNFTITSEPRGKSDEAHAKPIFVIQEHHASRLHWDFRLEADGALKSWAVPKEPTLDPSIKRLAVHVEDHPLPYAKFHGDIPAGQYGAGHVEIWDKGTYENLRSEPLSRGIAQGRIEFALQGKRLNGGFALIRLNDSKEKNWLLIKKNDADALRGESPPSPAAAAKIASKSVTSSRTRRAPAGAPTRSTTPRPRSSPRAVRKGDAKNSANAKRSTAKGSKAKSSDEPPAVALTHPDRIIYPQLGAAKADVFNFYKQVAPLLLPHLQDRPCTLERLPEGLASENSPHFWQKNTPDYYPDWIPRATLPAANGANVSYVLVNDLQSLLYLVNQGTLTFHIWMSRVQSPRQPDFVLFDLDPGDAKFSDAVEIANAIHAELDERGAASYPKTSGKSGLHIYCPWQQGDHDAARNWAMEVAAAVTGKLPKIATTERSIAKRKGRVYVDVMQNAMGRHVVPPYVLRATPPATVSMPLQWKDVNSRLDRGKFDIYTTPALLKRRKIDPMAKLVESWEGAGESYLAGTGRK